MAAWNEPGNFLQAMQAGANLGLNIRSQNQAQDEYANRLQQYRDDLLLKARMAAEENRRMQERQAAANALAVAELQQKSLFEKARNEMTQRQQDELSKRWTEQNRINEMKAQNANSITPFEQARIDYYKALAKKANEATPKVEKPTELYDQFKVAQANVNRLRAQSPRLNTQAAVDENNKNIARAELELQSIKDSLRNKGQEIPSDVQMVDQVTKVPPSHPLLGKLPFSPASWSQETSITNKVPVVSGTVNKSQPEMPSPKQYKSKQEVIQDIVNKAISPEEGKRIIKELGLQ